MHDRNTSTCIVGNCNVLILKLFLATKSNIVIIQIVTFLSLHVSMKHTLFKPKLTLDLAYKA